MIGGENPIPVQSMTNTDTLDTDSTCKQVMELADAGCDIVRITAPGIREANNLSNIKSALVKKGYDLPLVADIHFNPKAAEVAATIVKKIRINPGNYVDRNRGKADWSQQEVEEARERIAQRLFPLIEICKKNNTIIRIGTNHGSLSERILSMYGNTPEGMVESAMEFVRIVRGFDFHQLVLSMKASNFREMTKANILLVERMISEGFYYPIHLGVTEAGNGKEARIKSAAGIGSLLARGIGDTIRVSLAEDPVNEVPFGKQLVKNYGRNNTIVDKIIEETAMVSLDSDKSFKVITGIKNPLVGTEKSKDADFYLSNNQLIKEDKDGLHKAYDFHHFSFSEGQKIRTKPFFLKKEYPALNDDELLLRTAVDFGLLFSDKLEGGIWIKNLGETSVNQSEHSLNLLQGLGLRYSKAEFVACPSCGRTKFHLFESFEKVKEKTAHLKGLKIAVMGCIVNGPGEMADADYGYVGAGPGKVTLYKNREPIINNVDEDNAVDALVDLIKQNGDWRESK